MGWVTRTMELNTVGFRVRTGWFGRQILQIGHECQDWDTNSGCEDGPRYVIWRDADEHEAKRCRLVFP